MESSSPARLVDSKIFRELDEKSLAGGLFIHFVCGLLIGKFIFLSAKVSFE